MWEARLASIYETPASPCRINTQDPTVYMFYLHERNVANQVAKKRHLCENIFRMSELVMLRVHDGEPYEESWRKKTVLEREELVLEGLRYVTRAVTDESGLRFE